MPQARAAHAGSTTVSGVRFRFRYPLLLGIAVALVWVAVPRVRAAWALDGAATALADYAACMAGPTGPAAIRDGSEAYLLLLRRRLLASAADEAPFAACADEAARLPGPKPDSALQGATASAFVEYAGGPFVQPEGQRLTLDSLRLSPKPVADLAAAAWPFVRAGYSSRIRCSSHAKEAPHPLPAPKPFVGSGLPRWKARYSSVSLDANGAWLAHGQGANLTVLRSLDGGLNWVEAPQGTRAVAHVRERCLAGPKSGYFAFSTDVAGDNVTVLSLDPTGVLAAERALVSADYELVSASCGAGLLTALIRLEQGDPGVLVNCRHGGDCNPISGPSQARTYRAPPAVTDVVRVGRILVVSTYAEGVVRVASTRDEGRSWTPFSIAYDAHESARERREPAPTRLIAVGPRVLLYAAPPDEGKTYPVVVSEDFGASWRGAR